MKTIQVTLVKSLIGSTPNQRKTAQALGLSKINQSVTRQDTPTIRGMINVISHLVSVSE
jgi:large subunit ribosomal protein L30